MYNPLLVVIVGMMTPGESLYKIIIINLALVFLSWKVNGINPIIQFKQMLKDHYSMIIILLCFSVWVAIMNPVLKCNKNNPIPYACDDYKGWGLLRDTFYVYVVSCIVYDVIQDIKKDMNIFFNNR